MKLTQQDTLHLLKVSLEPIHGHFLRTYGVLCEPEALFIYQLLRSLESKEMSLEELCLISAMNLSQVNSALDKLYQLQLIDLKVSNQQNRIIRCEFKRPLSSEVFITHDVLGRQLLKKLGSSSFEKLRVSIMGQNLSDEGFSDYKPDLNSSVMQSWSKEDEQSFQKTSVKKNDIKSLNFDLLAFLNECSPLILPDSLRSEATLLAISEIGAVYGINVKDMIYLVGKAYVMNDTELNLDKLRKLAAKVEVSEELNLEDVYQYPPALFLKRLRKGIEPSSLEKYLLVKLVSKDGLKTEVLNVLLESHFNQYHSKINTKVLEEVALQWAYQNIRTKEEAFENLKSIKTKGKRVEVKTDYTNQSSSLSEEELKALEIALKNIK